MGLTMTKHQCLPLILALKRTLILPLFLKKKTIYDEIIGYLWPGCDSRLEYFKAKENAEEIKKRAFQFIQLIASEAKQVDVLAHSMGNYLFLEAMKKPEHSGLVTNYFSLGAAVDNESIQKGEVYYSSIKNCKEVYVAYSKEDDVLEYIYTLAELDKALGGFGIEDISKLPPHVQLVDCSKVVDAHSAYFECSQLYQFIQNRIFGIPPFPENAKKVELLINGEIVILPATLTFRETAKVL